MQTSFKTSMVSNFPPTYVDFKTETLSEFGASSSSDDQGLKRKREEVEPVGNLKILAEAVTTQQDQSQNILHASSRDKEVLQEGNLSDSRDIESMSSVPARTGRQRQRYEDNLRLVSGCIPYRWRKENADQIGKTEEMIEVLMISSPKRDDLVFPKGGWENDETVTEAACREALEEAGVKGILRETPLGIWEFRSKSSQDLCGMEGGCRGYMFALEVTEELESWPEQKNRARRWLNIKEAFRLSRYDWMCNALEEFTKVMEEDMKLEKQDNNDDPPSVLVTDVSECQSMSPNCYKRSSNMQHHGDLLQRASQEIAIHFGY